MSDVSPTSVQTLATGWPQVSITAKAWPPTVMYGPATVMLADIMCSNGVIHMIDEVVLPIITRAKLTGTHTKLVPALTTASLVPTLNGAGPFTMFAPTDAAFAALSMSQEELLARPDLADILKNHVLSGKIKAEDLSATQDVATLATASIAWSEQATAKVTIMKDSTAVKFGGATVTGADVECSNGVIHVIDAVVPPSFLSMTKKIVKNVEETGNHTVLVEALTAAGLVETLNGEGPFTVFAPTDDAFAALSITKADLLANILLYHVLDGQTLSSALLPTQSPTTKSEGRTVTITKDTNTDIVTFGSAAKVIESDILSSNGVIHVIDAAIVVLPPASPTPSPSPSPSPTPTPTPTEGNSSALTAGSPCVSSSWTVFIVGLLAVLMSLKIQ
jgi:uncharacterized surface protein with fasciclin (FAS1) repeats